MNTKVRGNTRDGYKRLAKEVVLLAIKDLGSFDKKNCKLGFPYNDYIPHDEAVKFFRSSLAEFYCFAADLDPDFVYKKIKGLLI